MAPIVNSGNRTSAAAFLATSAFPFPLRRLLQWFRVLVERLEKQHGLSRSFNAEMVQVLLDELIAVAPCATMPKSHGEVYLERSVLLDYKHGAAQRSDYVLRGRISRQGRV